MYYMYTSIYIVCVNIIHTFNSQAITGFRGRALETCLDHESSDSVSRLTYQHVDNLKTLLGGD